MEMISSSIHGEAPEAIFSDTDMNAEYESTQFVSSTGPSSTLWAAMNPDADPDMAAETTYPEDTHLARDAEMEYDEVSQGRAEDADVDVQPAVETDIEYVTAPEVQESKEHYPGLVTGVVEVQETEAPTESVNAMERLDNSALPADTNTVIDEIIDLQQEEVEQPPASADRPSQSAAAETSEPASIDRDSLPQERIQDGSGEETSEIPPVPAKASEPAGAPDNAANASTEPVQSADDDDDKRRSGPIKGGPMDVSTTSALGGSADVTEVVESPESKHKEARESPPAEEQETEALEPVLLTFHDQAFVLFSENGETSSYTAWDDQVGAIQDISAPRLAVDDDFFWETLDGLFQSLRVKEVLGEFLEQQDGATSTELLMYFPDLELKIGEDNVFTREVSCADLLRLHHGLGLRHSLRIEVSEEARFITQFNLLAQQISEAEKETATAAGAVEDAVTTADGEEGVTQVTDGAETEDQESVAAAPTSSETLAVVSEAAEDHVSAELPDGVVDNALEQSESGEALAAAETKSEEGNGGSRTRQELASEEVSGRSANEEVQGASDHAEKGNEEAEDGEEIVEYEETEVAEADDGSSAPIALESGNLPTSSAVEEAGTDETDTLEEAESAETSVHNTIEAQNSQAEEQEVIEDVGDEDSEETIRANDFGDQSPGATQGETSEISDSTAEVAVDVYPEGEDDLEEAYAAYEEDGAEEDEARGQRDDGEFESGSQSSSIKRAHEEDGETDEYEEASIDTKRHKAS